MQNGSAPSRSANAGTTRRIPGPDDPLRIAYLTYRGKPHVGGQGVYTRHLTKALVDLGHHAEVLSGQPYPILDERDPRVEARVRLPREHLGVVAEVDQRLGEVAGVHALAADVGFPTVREEGNTQREIAIRSTFDVVR